MKVLAERFDLPKDLHPEELDAELQREQEEKPKESKAPPPMPPGEAEATAPEESPPAPEEGPPPGDQAQDPKQVLAQIAQMPPAEAIDALRTVFADTPEIIQVLDQIATLPEQEQAAAIEELLGAASAGL